MPVVRRRVKHRNAYLFVSHRFAFARVGADDDGEAVVGCSRARASKKPTSVTFFDFVEDEQSPARDARSTTRDAHFRARVRDAFTHRR